VLAIVLLWGGIRRLRFTTLVAAAVSAVDLLVLALTLVPLGLWGLGVLVAVNLVCFGTWCIVQAARIDAELTFAATQANADRDEVGAVYQELTRNRDLRAMGARRHARFIRLLCERGRSPQEAREMAVPIGMLWLVHRPELDWLVEQFDCLLRRYNEPASEAMRVADVLTAGAQHSAATFEQLVIASVSSADGSAEPVPVG